MADTKQERIQSFLNSDRAMLALCIAISLFFWLLIKLSKEFTTEYESSIYYNLPQGKTFQEQPPQKVRASIKGSGWDLISNVFRSRNENIVVNLSDEVNQTIYQTQLKNKLNSGLGSRNIRIANLDLEYIQITLDNELVKKVPIVLKEELNFAPNFYKRDVIQCIPDSVSITGPLNYLDTIQAWPTENLTLANLEKDVSQQLKLTQKKESNVFLDPPEIEVIIPVEQYTEKSIFVPIQIVNAKDSLKIFPQSVKVNFQVGLSRFNTISLNDFLVEVDANQLQINQSNTVALQLKNQPDFLRNVRVSPKSVEFFFLKNEVEK